MKRKLYYLLFVFIILLTLTSCKKKTDDEILDELLASISFDEVLSNDLDLKSTYKVYGKVVNATWESSNDKVLTNDGKLYYTFKETDVNLKLTLELNGTTREKEFNFLTEAYGAKLFSHVEMPFDFVIYSSISLPSLTSYGKYNIKTTYSSSDTNIISNDGKVNYSKTDKEVTITVTYSYQSYTESFDYIVTVKAIDEAKVLEELKKLNFNESYDSDIELPSSINYYNDVFDIEYESSNQELLSNTGKVNQSNVATNVSLKVKTVCDIEYVYNITILPMSDETALNLAIKDITLPSLITFDLCLDTNFSYNTLATWISSNENVISNDGKINKNIGKEKVNLKLILSKGNNTMEKDFNIEVMPIKHLYQDRTFVGTKENLEIKNGKLVLCDNALTGTYTTSEIQSDEFYEAVGSYAATSSTKATCEFSVSIKVNNVWSKFITYGEWGQGLQNACHDQTDTYVKLNDDEIKVNSGLYATAFKLKIVLKRDALSTDSPIVSLLSLALNLKDYTYDVDISNLPKEVKWDVPCLYQHDVPSIGGSICSVTSSTMLLKFKGHDFTSINPLEHEYMAYIIKDYGNNIFGNWVYNTIAMGSFGEDAYVKRFYSYNEIIHSLATVGPMAASIKGTTISDKKTYTTNGHLIVITGYKIEGNQTYFYINDPNVYGVQVIMTLENLKAVNRMVSYIVE